MIRIRFATDADVPQILAFVQSLAAYEKLSHEVQATEGSLYHSLFGPRPYAEVLIAEIKGVPCGFALFFHNYSTFLAKPGLYLEDLYVIPDYRGHGVGQALFKRLAQIALERDCGRLEWSVLDWNEPAIGFYQSLGAIAMDEWTVYRLSGKTLAALA